MILSGLRSPPLLPLYFPQLGHQLKPDHPARVRKMDAPPWITSIIDAGATNESSINVISGEDRRRDSPRRSSPTECGSRIGLRALILEWLGAP